jgi:hypothetical protein
MKLIKTRNKLYLYVSIIFISTFLFNVNNVYSQSNIYKIDFGYPTLKTTDLGWNNVTSDELTNVINLVDVNGSSTPLTIQLDKPINADNDSGTQVSSIYPINATRDSIYISSTGFVGSPTGYNFTFRGLVDFNTYSFNIYGSREGSLDVRTADFTANGSTTISHDASSNVDNFDTIANISPDENNEILLEMSLGTGNTNSNDFGYLGVIEIIENTPSFPGPPSISSIDVNPGYNNATISWDTNECLESTVYYGLDTNYGNSTSTDVCIETQSVYIDSLSPDTTYNYIIVSTDADNETSTTTNATFTTDASNLSPNADAGDDQNITLPTSSVLLSGLDSDDPDDEISSYLWEEITNTNAYIVNPDSATTTISDLLPATTTTFQLTVTDENGNTDTDLVNIDLNNSNSTAPAKKIVILGSSTAAGNGASTPSESWASQFTDYLDELSATNTVDNLAVGGYTTEDILPVAEGGVSGRNIE